MIAEICAEIRNYFIKSNNDIHEGFFEISDGGIIVDFLKDGQFFRIVGSALNDGVYRYPAVGLFDETFDGAVWAMSVPSSFVALAEEIKEYTSGEGGKLDGYVSESFGGYTYTKATTASGAPVSWNKLFASRLNVYRRINIQ